MRFYDETVLPHWILLTWPNFNLNMYKQAYAQ